MTAPMTRPMKKPGQSYSEQIQIVMSNHINGSQRLFGGRLLEWIDVVAGVVARRHSGCDITTATIDRLQFLSSAHVNDTIVLAGRVTWVGNTSMEVRVDTFVEEFSGKRTLVNRAYLVLVALDKNERPARVPGLLLETDEEWAEWEAGVMRQKIRNEERKRNG